MGCDVPPRPPIDPSDIVVEPVQSVEASPSQSAELLERPSQTFSGNWESWDAYFVKGKQVGYSHVSVEAVSDRPASDVRQVLENVTFATQGNSRLLQRLQQTSVETFDGRLVSFEGNLKVGPTMTQFEGSVADETLEIETVRGSSRSIRSVPWQSTHHGLIALEQTLRAKPIRKKGESRTIRMLVPGSYQLVTTRLRCTGMASVPMMDGNIVELVEIESEIKFDATRATYTTIWTNESGEILRTFSPGLHLVAYRTDKSTATKLGGSARVTTEMAVKGRIDQPDKTKRVAFKVKATPQAVSKNAAIEIVALPGQYIRKSDNTQDVLVSRRSEKVGKGFVADSLVPSDADRQANFFVDFKSTLVRRYADTAIGSQSLSQQETALELAHVVNSLITNSDEFNGLVPASEVANLGRGDSTAQAILLAAMLRTRRIPSQIVFGLRYVSGEPNRMVYHAWTLAYVDSEWVHLDATEGGDAPADRIALATTNLSKGKEYESLVPFLNAVGRMEVEVIGAQY